jgi:hypothetical protein
MNSSDRLRPHDASLEPAGKSGGSGGMTVVEIVADLDTVSCVSIRESLIAPLRTQLQPTMRHILERPMSSANPYKAFVSKYLQRGTVGVSVGLAAVTLAPRTVGANVNANVPTPSFAGRLSTIRSAVSEYANQAPTQVAQVAHPFPSFAKAPLFRDFGNSK